MNLSLRLDSYLINLYATQPEFDYFDVKSVIIFLKKLNLNYAQFPFLLNVITLS